MSTTRRKGGPKYVGGCFVLSCNPLLWSTSLSQTNAIKKRSIIWKDGNDHEKESLNYLAKLVSRSLPDLIPQVRSFFYILYPVSDEAWRSNPLHTTFLFHLYSALNHVVTQKSENPILDIGVFPIYYTAEETLPHASHTFNRLQLDALSRLLLIDDPSASRFIERKHPDGPVALFRFLPDDERREFTSTTLTGNRSTITEESLYIPREPNHGSSFTNSILHLCFTKGLTLHNVDVTHYAEESSTTEFTLDNNKTIEEFLFTGIQSDNSLPVLTYDSLLIAGTFDHLHAGHKLLFTLMSFITQKKVTIGIVSDEGSIIAKKLERQFIHSFQYRSAEVIQFFQTLCHLLNISTKLHLPSKTANTYKSVLCPKPLAGDKEGESLGKQIDIEIFELHDPIGPAGYRCDLDGLLVTQDTRKGGEGVNTYRVEKGIPPLKLIEFPLLNDDNVCTTDPNISNHKPSSSHVRVNISTTPIITDLRNYWNKISATIQLPSSMSSVWCIRLLEHFALPWRRLNRYRLHQMLCHLWDYCQSKIHSNDRAWLSLGFWLSLCVILEETRSEGWKIEQRVACDKLKYLVKLFVQDLKQGIELSLCPKIETIWRTEDCRLKGFKNEIGNLVEKNFYFVDLQNNLIDLGEYLLVAFVPKAQQIVLNDVDSTISSSDPKSIIEHRFKEIYGKDLVTYFQQTIDFFIYEFFQKSYRSDCADYVPEGLESPTSSMTSSPLL